MNPKFNIHPHRPSSFKMPVKQPRQMKSFAIMGIFAAIAIFACLEGFRFMSAKQEAAPVAQEKKAPVTPTIVAEKPTATVKQPVAKPEVAKVEKPAAELVPEVIPEVVETDDKTEVFDAAAARAQEWAAETPILLTDLDSTRDNAVKRDKELIEKAINHGALADYRLLLAKSIRTSMDDLDQGKGSDRFDPVWKEPLLYRALLRWKTLGALLQPGFEDLVTDSYKGAFLIWLLDKPEAMEELLLTISPADDAIAAHKLLMEIWALNQEDVEKFEKYFSLALACALVFDKPVSITTPTGVGKSGSLTTVDPLERYLWYVENNEKGKLAAPVHRSNARDLVWVVCAPVATSELDWAISKLSGRRNSWGKQYGAVKYLMERAVKGLNPYKEYTFAEILKHGGICSDQAYFCVHTARAQGIPAMILAGETALGGHAWAGLKLEPDEWTTQVGRIGGVSKGGTGHPQTGAGITEQEILHWNVRQLRSPNITLSVWRHLWLASFFSETEQDKNYSETIRLANSIGQPFPETWQALYTLLESEMELTGEPAKPNNLEEWKSFAKDMRREFQDNPRMAGLAADAEMEYIFPYGTINEAKRTLLRERRRVSRDASEQADLVADSLKRQADLIHKKGGPDVRRDIGRIYDRALRDYGGSVTGFKMMASDYFSFMKDDPASARKAARDVELAFKRVVETGTKDWFRAKTESEIYGMICNYYRAAGENNRANMLENRIKVLMRRAERGAL